VSCDITEFDSVHGVEAHFIMAVEVEGLHYRIWICLTLSSL